MPQGRRCQRRWRKAGEGTWPGLWGLGWGPPNPGQGYADMGRSWGVGGRQWEKGGGSGRGGRGKQESACDCPSPDRGDNCGGAEAGVGAHTVHTRHKIRAHVYTRMHACTWHTLTHTCTRGHTRGTWAHAHTLTQTREHTCSRHAGTRAHTGIRAGTSMHVGTVHMSTQVHTRDTHVTHTHPMHTHHMHSRAEGGRARSQGPGTEPVRRRQAARRQKPGGEGPCHRRCTSSWVGPGVRGQGIGGPGGAEEVLGARPEPGPPRTG